MTSARATPHPKVRPHPRPPRTGRPVARRLLAAMALIACGLLLLSPAPPPVEVRLDGLAPTFGGPGTVVTIAGSGIAPNAQVAVCSAPATAETVNAQGTALTFVVPALDGDGFCDVVVHEGDAIATLSDAFEFWDPPAPIRINSGSSEPYTTSDGRSFEADRYASADSITFTNPEVGDGTIGGTLDDVLYLTERVTAIGSFTYAIPVEKAAVYQVRLHFAEIWWGAPGGGPGSPGARVFSVGAEGRSLLVDFDLLVEAPALNAIVKSFAVEVTDGVLDLAFTASADAPKVSAIEVLPSERGTSPRITGSNPFDGASNVLRDAAVRTTLYVPFVGGGVDDGSLSSTSVRLYRTADRQPVVGAATASGGRDSIIFQPSALLQANTEYTFEVSEAVTDTFGNPFEPYVASFRTGVDVGLAVDPVVAFEREKVFVGGPIASAHVGPDGRLYAVGLDGLVRRWTIAPDGTLSGVQTFDGFAGRALIGLAFDPDEDGILWVTHNDPLPDVGAGAVADDWTGGIAKVVLDPADLAASTRIDYVEGLPRSTIDHMTNGLAFGPDGFLYVSQGSNTSTGAPDAFWGNRPERLLTAAVLRVDPDLTFGLPIDVRTAPVGAYDPFAPGAPVTLHATGLRNAYDLVFHTNGHLYVPTNGGNGGNTPPGAGAPALEGLPTLPDFLYSVAGGGYYGHPNPLRGEYVLNGGNPTGTLLDGDEVIPNGTFAGYPTGTQPDANYRGFVERFCCNDSINGAVEYSATGPFGGALAERLLIVRYQAGADVVALSFNAAGTSVTSRTRVAGAFTNPLDLTEDPATGNLYLVEYHAFDAVEPGHIWLLTPAAP